MVSNPFKPTAGKNPPMLIGRDFVLDEFTEGIENGPGAPNRLMRISGMRGMGKTVVLNKIAERAADMGWAVVEETANEGFSQRILEALLPRDRVSKVTAEPTAFGISMGNVEFERASLSLREAMRARIDDAPGLLITLDEVQDASINEMTALSVAIQHMIREDADIAFAFAGLPSMIESVVNGKTLTFLRRAIPIELGPVGAGEVACSLERTFEDSGLPFEEPEEASVMAAATHGYPFMVQLVGYHVWQLAKRSGVGNVQSSDVERGIAMARDRFDATVIEPALQRLPASLMEYLLAMAEGDEAVSESGVVAARMGKTVQQVSAIRSRLIKEDVIESVGWGKVSFAIPYMAEYLNKHRDALRAEMGLA